MGTTSSVLGRSNMDWILDDFGSLQRKVQASSGSRSHKRGEFAASSSEASPNNAVPPRLKQVNDHIFEVMSPSGKSLSVEVVFFHGLQLEQSDQPDLDTWLSADGTQLWLNWITQKFSDARILTVKYDAQPIRNNEGGLMDMYITTESLLQCLTQATPAGAEVGQHGCPVLLVGHCIGGLVMKQLCVYANWKVAQSSERRNKHVQKFLKNVKGFFFYASPHHGTRLADFSREVTKGPLFKDVTTLNAEGARRNEDFRVLRQKFDWRTFGIVESLEITVGGFTGLIVQEGSARHDVDGVYTARANHFDVCRPDSPISSTFSLLSNFVASAVKEGEARCNPKIRFIDEDEVVGLDNKVIEVQKKLKTVSRLDIVGMAGIGKTTLARILYNIISGNYDYTCYLHEAKRFMDEEVNPEKLRMEIIQNLFKKKDKVDASFHWSSLKGKRVLIILYDVVSVAQVRVMTKKDGFSDESHVIVTSREQEFLKREEFKFFNVNPLSKEESKQLFCISAFKKADAPSQYENRVATMTVKCGGFPLALKIVGRFLYDRPDEKTWAEALTRLSNAIPLNGKAKDGLWSTLKMSYEKLYYTEQDMFLDIATFLHGEWLSVAKKIWSNCWKFDDIGWTNLVERGFVTEKGGYNPESKKFEMKIQMHEVLRDLGRSIACPKAEIITHHSRVNYHSADGIPTWPFRSQGIPQVRVLKINFDDQHLQKVKFNDIKMLRKLGELRFLWLDGGSLYGACHRLPEELVYLKIQSLQSWTDSESEEGFYKEIEPHQQLRYLEIEMSRNLESLPRSLGQLKALEYLEINNCWELNSLPNTLGELEALKHLEIRFCRKLKALSGTLGKLEALEHLTIDDCGQLSLPDTRWQLQKLKHLQVSHCRSIGNLGDYLEQFEALEYLRLNIHSFPGSLVKLRRLEYLHIERMWDRALPNIFGKFPALKELRFTNCDNLGGLPNSLGELKGLDLLEISECSSFKSLPTTIGQLKALKYLAIKSCPLLTAVPDSVSHLRDLEYLSMSHVPNNLGELRELRTLCLVDCGLEYLPRSIVQLQALESLELVGCHHLKALPDNIVQLQALKRLTLNHVISLNSLPESIGGLHALESLTLEICHSLEALPDSIGLLHALKYLKISHARNLTALPDTLGQLRSLEKLKIECCYHLQSLPDTLGRLESLDHLTIWGCDGLREVPDTIQIRGNGRYVRVKKSLVSRVDPSCLL